MPAEKVNLTIYFDDNEWEYLVQLSQRNKDNTVSDTVHQIVLRELRTFLLGVIEGTDQGHDAAMNAINKTYDNAIKILGDKK